MARGVWGCQVERVARRCHVLLLRAAACTLPPCSKVGSMAQLVTPWHAQPPPAGEGEARAVEGQVQQLLQSAQDHDQLSRMYVGWQAWC